MELITKQVARELVASGAVRRVIVSAQPDGYSVVFQTLGGERGLSAARKPTQPRIFRTSEGAFAQLRTIDVHRVEVDLGGAVNRSQGRLI